MMQLCRLVSGTSISKLTVHSISFLTHIQVLRVVSGFFQSCWIWPENAFPARNEYSYPTFQGFCLTLPNKKVRANRNLLFFCRFSHLLPHGSHMGIFAYEHVDGPIVTVRKSQDSRFNTDGNYVMYLCYLWLRNIKTETKVKLEPPDPLYP